MIKIQINLTWPGYAQGKYSIKAKGFILAVLRWGTSDGPLPYWSPFAYVPVDPAGNGMFFFPGKRGIPNDASRVWARCYTPDFTGFEDAFCDIQGEPAESHVQHGVSYHFSVLTDLHLASKPWKTRQALKAAESDIIFLLGDSTNDGLAEQFAEFRDCIESSVPKKTLFPVIGNHDVLHSSQNDSTDGCGNYAEFQEYLHEKAGKNGYHISYDPDNQAYAVQLGNLDIIGLQCVTTGRKFLFPEGRQLDWLENHLSMKTASWHIILCHAPLLAHNPNRVAGVPYLDKNRRLQEIVDRNKRIIFLSGHTHVSPNVLTGNAEYDEKNQNIYLDCGSVVATDTSDEKGIMSPEWKDGCKTELTITEDMIEICMSSIGSGLRFPRGFYRFNTEKMNAE